ncbi:MAG: MerR family transcriptional regulator [Bacteroidetes bacterium]|nr:MerR family transcriptional regulator [Bacteroidota bacterium]
MENTAKLYYSIGEVSRIIGVETYVLRYWESEFPELRPRKNSSGRRIYTNNDLNLARQIYDLLRVKKYTLEGARQALDGDSGYTSKLSSERQELLNLRSFLENIARQLT